jgi:spermidine synthase
MNIVILTYCIFFFSGFAALIYEIVWVRYLGLVFGGSHLAVTSVLSVYMAGLALGSYVIGRRIDGQRHLLRLFGLLELGTAVSAMLFLVLMKLYPSFYISIARFAPESPLYLSVIRVSFAVLALIIPTALMGGTLPVITAFATRLLNGAGIRLSFLYGCNTIGAVSGAAATGFFMLRTFSMQNTLLAAVLINSAVGVIAISMDRGIDAEPGTRAPERDMYEQSPESQYPLSCRLVIWGIGVSGFCAMAYEVLWNRILSIAIGASTYGFTILLMAFLCGIGLGSLAFGVLRRVSRLVSGKPLFSLRHSIIFFGLVQVAIGVTALLATSQFRNLPGYVAFLHEYFLGIMTFAGDQFQVTQLANFILVFSIMFIPAFFMGMAFPLAGDIHCRYRSAVGQAVGELLFSNTIGAILGAMCSGYLLIYYLGIQRSLQLIILINIGCGLYILASLKKDGLLRHLAGITLFAAVMVPVVAPNVWRIWDPKLYAIYQSNKPEEFGTADELREMLSNIDVRYYAEGAQSIVSSVQSADILYFITNGRVEASNDHQDMQCQYTLGHVPMLLHKNPRSVFVLGTGSGMTLGAVSVHPGVERITLAEIEPGVLGVARTFGVDNHYILNKPDPRLRIVFNDGRNHLLTTSEKYDVITADPVHPWFSGAGYLYSTEYFRLVSQKLNPGGIMCQWLPLYELTAEDLKSVVRTITANFAYTMVWVTHYDAEIVASNSPIIIDEAELGRRIAHQQVLADLRQIRMGSAEALLSYFVMGTKGANTYGRSGRINTDDNLYLEFSAPRSIGKEYLRGANLAEILKHRERLHPYLRPPEREVDRVRQQREWDANYQAALLDDKVHVLGVEGKSKTYEYAELAAELEDRYPRYAPWRFMKEESGDEKGGAPKLLKEVALDLVGAEDAPVTARFSAILVRKNDTWARIFFIDDDSRTVFGKLRVRGRGKDGYINNTVAKVMSEVQSLYASETAKASAAGKKYPSLLSVFPRIKTLVEQEIDKD